MTLPSLATTDGLKVRLGIDLPNKPQAQALLNYASSLIRAHTGQLWVDEHGELLPLPDGVPEVCVEMVFRAVTNPAGATQDTAGPFSLSFGPEAAQRIYLSKSDKEILGGAGGRPDLWTQRVTRGPIETETVYVPVAGGGAPIPFLEGFQ